MKATQGSPVSDTDGARQSTVLFPAGVTAQVYNADGSTRSVSALHVQMTEFTVGDAGPRAMPGELPAVTGYTYAIELMAAEAGVKIAGKEVLFAPVVFYEKNFLDFPVGGSVPLGYYDGERGAWVPNDNGRVVKIVSITTGKANLDTDGDGVADNNPALGITDTERERLAGLYNAGQACGACPPALFDLGRQLAVGRRTRLQAAGNPCQPDRPAEKSLLQRTARQRLWLDCGDSGSGIG